MYGLCLDDMGKTYSVRHGAALTAQLPLGSRVWRDFSDLNEWSLTNQLMARLVNNTSDILWVLAGGKRSRRPEPIVPGKTQTTKNKDLELLEEDEYLDRLKTLRGGE